MKILALVLALLSTSVLAVSLFEFTPNEATWYVRNDSVMGGVSNSSFRLNDGLLEFAGRISLANGGGFAGLRTTLGRYDLSAFSSLTLRVRGDGKRYALQLGDNLAQGVTYRYEFGTVAGKWLEIRAPFRAMRATRSGEFIRAARLDTSRVAFFGLITRTARAERFKLELDWIKAQ